MNTSTSSVTHGAIIIPANHTITGTCGKCGGPVVSPIMWGGTSSPPEHCHQCGAIPKPLLQPAWGPLREMKP